MFIELKRYICYILRIMMQCFKSHFWTFLTLFILYVYFEKRARFENPANFPNRFCRYPRFIIKIIIIRPFKFKLSIDVYFLYSYILLLAFLCVYVCVCVCVLYAIVFVKGVHKPTPVHTHSCTYECDQLLID